MIRCMGCGAPGATRDPEDDEARLIRIAARALPLAGWRLCRTCLDKRDAALAPAGAST
jgi:hypothetical protein